ncbi:MAG: protein kinase [Gemmatimonadetes bacterium]|nr:protein kinase [Gemmatimonadota bacterium]
MLKGDKGTYTIQKRIGQFSDQGVTYEALASGRKVIIKTPNIDISRPHDEITKRLTQIYDTFTAEFQAWQNLQGLRCAAAVRDLGITTATKVGPRSYPVPFIVQQYIRGPTLRDHVDKCGPCTNVNDWSRLATKLTQALAEVHARGVVHGDLWPPNVILSGNNPVLIDFGQSVLVDFAFDQAGAKGFDFPYCAPERRSPHGRWHYGADIYALGGVLLFLATARDPWPKPIFDLDDVHRATVKALKHNNNRLLTQNEGIAHIIGRCLRGGPQERSQSPEAVLQDLETFFPPKRRPLVKTAADLRSTATRLQEDPGSLYASIASVRLRATVRELRDMTRGLFHVAGDHNAIITSFSQALAVLRPGDVYLAVTVPLFWRPDNIGIMGRFYTMNLEIAKRGVRVRRVFMLTGEDEKDRHFGAIIEAHQQLHNRLNKANTKPSEIDDRRVTYFCGFVRRNFKEQADTINRGEHFGVWRSGSQHLLLVPYYTDHDRALAGVRFWMCPPGNVERRLDLFTRLLDESTPISALPVASEARRLTTRSTRRSA